MTLDPGMTGPLVHHRGVESVVMTYPVHFRRVHCHTKKEAAIGATVRAISPTIAAIEDRKSDRNEHHAKTTAVTRAKPHAISRLPGASRSLDTA